MRSSIGRWVSLACAALCALALTSCTNLTFDSSAEDSHLVTLPSGRAELERHELLYMSATFVFNFAEGPADDAEWTSSDTSVVTVDPAGSRAVVTAIAPGTSTISVSSSSVTTTIAITVRTPHATSLLVAPAQPKVPVGTDLPMTATASMSDGETRDVTSSATWSSSVPGIATVSGGLVHGVSKGDSTVTAKFDEKFSSTRVTVN